MGLFVSGGGGVPKSRLVAAATQAANVLKNTFFVNANGARTEGTMKDDQGLTVNANVSATAQPGKVVIDIPERACYNTSSKLQIDDSQFGDAATGDCIFGKSMTSTAGFNVGGTMSDYSGQAKQASALDKNGTNIRMKVPNTGKYSTGSYLTYPASNFGNAAAADVDSSVSFTSSAGVKVQGTGKKVAVSGITTDTGGGGTVWSFPAVVGGIYVIAVQSIYSACSISDGAVAVVDRSSGGGYGVKEDDGTIKGSGTVCMHVVRATKTTITMTIDSRTWAGSRRFYVRVA